MTWFWVIVGAVIVGGIFGFLTSTNEKRREGAVSGALASGVGCASIIFQIAMAFFGLFILFKLGSWLFS